MILKDCDRDYVTWLTYNCIMTYHQQTDFINGDKTTGAYLEHMIETLYGTDTLKELKKGTSTNVELATRLGKLLCITSDMSKSVKHWDIESTEYDKLKYLYFAYQLLMPEQEFEDMLEVRLGKRSDVEAGTKEIADYFGVTVDDITSWAEMLNTVGYFVFVV